MVKNIVKGALAVAVVIRHCIRSLSIAYNELARLIKPVI